MPAALKANSSLAQTRDYERKYLNAVQRAMNPGGRGGFVSISRIRGPAYSQHEHCLDQARNLTDHQAGVSLMLALISGICDGCIMADCGFPCADVYKVLQAHLQGLARDVQEGRREKTTTIAWAQKECFDDLLQMTYVTGSAGHNFAGEDLGDWASLQTRFLEDVNKRLAAQEQRAAKERALSEKVAIAKANLEALAKETQNARKKVTTCEAKERKAERELENYRKDLEKMRAIGNQSSGASVDGANTENQLVKKRPAASRGSMPQVSKRNRLG
eukprot:TRINITY_DN30544_c0_g1_i1.p1 TRINITY_DN30544_c0_g1~~TRINITY_DN30544_c0_g1_i1.p1  ORF type:complete len:298 (-),score=48.31 TRINITY_DN30544_c0_g1_i1:138-959(-)